MIAMPFVFFQHKCVFYRSASRGMLNKFAFILFLLLLHLPARFLENPLGLVFFLPFLAKLAILRFLLHVLANLLAKRAILFFSLPLLAKRAILRFFQPFLAKRAILFFHLLVKRA